MHLFDRTLYLQICIWKQTFSLGKDERYRLTFDWRFSALSQSEIRVHWWTRNSKNPTNLGRREFNSTLHQSSHGLATRVHGFTTKTKALAHEIPPATQATFLRASVELSSSERRDAFLRASVELSSSQRQDAFLRASVELSSSQRRDAFLRTSVELSSSQRRDAFLRASVSFSNLHNFNWVLRAEDFRNKNRLLVVYKTECLNRKQT